MISFEKLKKHVRDLFLVEILIGDIQVECTRDSTFFGIIVLQDKEGERVIEIHHIERKKDNYQYCFFYFGENYFKNRYTNQCDKKNETLNLLGKFAIEIKKRLCEMS